MQPPSRPISMIVTVAILALSACHKAPPVPAPADGSVPAETLVQSPAPVVTPAPVVNAQTYLMKAGTADLFEVESSRAILKTTARKDVIAFARTMIESHQHAWNQVTQAAREAGVKPPAAALTPERQQQLNAIKAAPGLDADKLYLDDQRAILVAEFAVHKSYGADGDNAALRPLAARLAMTIEHQMNALGRIKRE